MIHFIDRVYLDYAEAKPLPQNPLLKPEAYIRIIDRGLVDVVDADTLDKNLFNVKNVDEAFAKFGDQNLFINFLLSNCNVSDQKKIIIYADEIATIKLFCSLWKTVFPKITAQGAYKIYQTYKDFEFFKPKDQINFIAFDEDSREITKSYFFNKYWGKTFEEFQELFNPVPKFDLTPDQKEKLGTEYQMVKYILKKDADHSVLFNKVRHFYKKSLMKEILGLKSLVSEYIYTILDTEKDDTVVLSEKSAVDKLKTHTKYSLLLDDQIVYSIKGYEHLKDKYNLIKVCQDLLNGENIALASMGITPEKKDNPCCNYIAEKYAEPDLTEIIDEECFYNSSFRLFRELAKKGRYNQYLVYSFAASVKKGTESLAEFSE